MEKIKVAVIGGGSGSHAVLNGIKIYPDISISAIVAMTDDGGSNETVRDEFGLLPLSDIRKSIIGLADDDKDDILRELFMYRFYKGQGFSGHTLGNIIMMALSDITGSEVSAINATLKLFDIENRVIPVTTDKVKLGAQYDNGKKIIGEHLIGENESNDKSKITKLFLHPKAKANKDAVNAILEADYIIIGPGDLYTTTLANVIVDGIPQALSKTKAQIILITNIMTKMGETHWMKMSDFVKEVTKYAKRKPDIVICHDGILPNDILKRYEKENAYPIRNDIADDKDYLVLTGDIIAKDPIQKVKGDKLKRSLIRHDSYKLGYILYGIFKKFEF